MVAHSIAPVATGEIRHRGPLLLVNGQFRGGAQEGVGSVQRGETQYQRAVAQPDRRFTHPTAGVKAMKQQRAAAAILEMLQRWCRMSAVAIPRPPLADRGGRKKLWIVTSASGHPPPPGPTYRADAPREARLMRPGDAIATTRRRATCRASSPLGGTCPKLETHGLVESNAGGVRERDPGESLPAPLGADQADQCPHRGCAQCPHGGGPGRRTRRGLSPIGRPPVHSAWPRRRIQRAGPRPRRPERGANGRVWRTRRAISATSGGSTSNEIGVANAKGA